MFIIVFVLFLGAGFLFLSSYFTFDNFSEDICGDGTEFGKCSHIKPFYCENGKLIEKASICNCSDLAEISDDSCKTQYHTKPKNVTFKYVLRGVEGEINYTVYQGLVDYIGSLSPSIRYQKDDIPERRDFKLKRINEPYQKELIMPLVAKIQDITSNKKDQVRIAISLVQNIPFGFSDKKTLFFLNEINYERYPYEVLYDHEGVCGEKSDLLALLLKELNYGSALFYHAEENHESAGVSCPLSESLANSGYCFVETTGSSIITNDEIVYVNGLILESEPEVMVISEGNSLDKNMYEYKDADRLIELDKKIRKTGRLNPLEWYLFQNLKEKYQLAEYYDPR